MKILVTGSNGLFAQSFIDHISDKFLNKNEFFFTSNTAQIEKSKFNFYQVNLFEEGRVKELLKKIQPHILVHFAWDVRKQNYLNNLTNEQWYLKSKFLIDEFYNFGGIKFYGIGTLAEYSPKIEEIYLKSVRSPTTLYGIFKNKLHDYLELNHSNRYMWIRLGSVFNLKSRRINLFQTIFKSINENIEMDLPLIQHPYMNVGRYGYLINKLVEEEIHLKQVNLGAHIPISTVEIINTLKNKLNIDIKYKLNENIGLNKKYYLSQFDIENYQYGVIDSRKEFDIFVDDTINSL